MKRIFFSLVLCFLVLSPVMAMAADNAISNEGGIIFSEPIDNSAAQLFLGQQHNYTVTMRGNGESVVYAKISFTNFTETDLNSLKFKTEAKLNELVAFQQILPDVCKEKKYNQETRTYDCLQYGPPAYYNQNSYYYYNNSNLNAKYSKSNFSITGDQYEFSLPTAVKPNEQGAILLAYRSKDYVDKKALGLFKFHFTTLTAPVKVNDVNVAIKLDSELYMKGQKSEVNYKSMDIGLSAGLSETASFQNPTLDTLSSELGYSGQLKKTAKDLAPDESFTVNGKYATTKFRLYLPNVIIGALALALLIIILYFLNKHFTKKNDSPTGLLANGPSLAENQKQSSFKDEQITLFNGQYLVWSFISSLILFFLSYSMKWISDVRWSSIFPDGTEFIIVVGVIILILVYIFLIFGVPIIFASKHGWRAFVSVLLDIIVISSILFFILIGIFTLIK